MIRYQTRRLLASIRYYVFHTVLHADDPPHRLALGIAIGIFITFTPTIGFQMGLVVVAAWLFKANKLVGIPLVWISNPVTFVPIYYPCYCIGQNLLGLPNKDLQWWHELRSPPEERWEALKFYYGRILEVIAPLTVGCLIVASVLAVFAYFFSLLVIRQYRIHRWGQLIPPV